jgi:hypothetical protein
VPDLDLQLRAMLERKADEMPAHAAVPGDLRDRARRRIARNAVAVGLAMVVLAAGAFVGARTVLGARATEPAGHAPHVTIGARSPSSGGSRVIGPVGGPCAVSDLRVSAALQAAAGSREGDLVFTNTSAGACALQGSPVIRLFTQRSAPIASDVSFLTSPPSWVVDHLPKPKGWPVITVRPGRAASVRVRWSNWCIAGGEVPVWRVGIADVMTAPVVGIDASSVPPCNGPALPSTIEVGPFEPRAGPGP